VTSRVRARAGIGPWVLLCAVGCAGRPAAAPPPRIVVATVREGADGARCGERVEAVRGRVPVDARVVLRLTVRADRPVPLALLEETAALHAARACADGLATVQATEAAGTGKSTEAVLVAWASQAPQGGVDGDAVVDAGALGSAFDEPVP
jgi:hypothetical protein